MSEKESNSTLTQRANVLGSFIGFNLDFDGKENGILTNSLDVSSHY